MLYIVSEIMTEDHDSVQSNSAKILMVADNEELVSTFLDSKSKTVLNNIFIDEIGGLENPLNTVLNIDMFNTSVVNGNDFLNRNPVTKKIATVKKKM